MADWVTKELDVSYDAKNNHSRKISLYQFPGYLRPPQLATCYRITEGRLEAQHGR